MLQRQQVILLGAFNRFAASRQDAGYGLNHVWQWLREHTRATVLSGLPPGHGVAKVALPVGATVQVQQEGRDVFVLWGARIARVEAHWPCPEGELGCVWGTQWHWPATAPLSCRTPRSKGSMRRASSACCKASSGASAVAPTVLKRICSRVRL